MKIRSALICRLSYLALLLAAGAGCTPTPSNDNPDGGSSGDDGGNPSTPGPDAGTGSDAAATGGNEAGSTGGNDAGVGGNGSTPDGGSPDAATVMVPVMTPNGPTPPASLTGMTITGSACTISSATTWLAGIYDINCNDELEVDSVLTINQGAVIKFEANNYVRVSATGTLNAIGGPTTPIVFTSIKDDAHGGDTNGDGSATSPKAGDWAGIELQGTNNSTLSECAFEYQGGTNGAVFDSSAAPVTVTNSVFAHNRPTTDSITSAPALDLTDAPAGNVVQGNVFYDNGVPIGINGNSSLDDTNSFDDSAAAPDSPQPNEYNGIVVNTGPDINGHISWGTTKVPYVLTDGTLDVGSTGTLSLADGATVKFSSGTSLWVAGVLSSPGSSGIVLTSIKDDAHGGDTNGDSSATTPTAGDWNGVVLANSTGSHFNKTGFYYAGGDSGAALNVGSTAAVITNCIFAHDKNTTDSITALGALDASSAPAATQITGNLFYDNRVPLGISPLISIDDSNSFDNSAASPANPEPNEYNGIVVNNVGPNIDGMTSWKATKVPFAIAPNLDIEGTGTLTLGSNVTLKFYAGSSSGIRVAQGGVLAAGTGDILTSIRDDAHGGDTNGDGSATTPAAGDWWGVAGYGTSGLGSSSAPLSCLTVGTEYYATCN